MEEEFNGSFDGRQEVGSLLAIGGGGTPEAAAAAAAAAAATRAALLAGAATIPAGMPTPFMMGNWGFIQTHLVLV